MLIGSWCVPFYKEYLKTQKIDFVLKTRDVDFLIPSASRIKEDVNVAELLEDLGFIVERSYPGGYIRLTHTDLMVEFLIPEQGKGTNKPVPIPKLSLNAQALRYLNLLTEKTIEVLHKGIMVRLPEPIRFSLHKLIVAQERESEDKAEKDREAGVVVLKVLIGMGKDKEIKEIFDSLPPKWRKKILLSCKEANEEGLLSF